MPHAAAYLPPALYAALLAGLLFPGALLFRDSRLFFGMTLWRIVTPLRSVSWADFLLADILTSLAKALSDTERAVCHMMVGPTMQADVPVSPAAAAAVVPCWLLLLLLLRRGGLPAPHTTSSVPCTPPTKRPAGLQRRLLHPAAGPGGALRLAPGAVHPRLPGHGGPPPAAQRPQVLDRLPGGRAASASCVLLGSSPGLAGALWSPSPVWGSRSPLNPQSTHCLRSPARSSCCRMSSTTCPTPTGGPSGSPSGSPRPSSTRPTPSTGTWSATGRSRSSASGVSWSCRMEPLSCFGGLPFSPRAEPCASV